MEKADQTEQVRQLTGIGSLLPDLFAVFDDGQLSLVSINAAGKALLDPSGKAFRDSITLADIVGVNEIDRFHREIYPQTRVHGFWAGALVMRDISGSEFTCRVKLLDAADGSKNTGRLLYLYAVPLAEGEESEHLVSDRDMLSALLETVPDRVYFKDITSRFLRISKALATKFEITSPRDAIGKTDFDFFTPEHAAPAFQDEQSIIKTNQPLIGVEEKETYNDGTSSWVSTSKLPFYNREGKLIGTYGISRDITARKKNEDAIRRSEAILRATFTAAPVGIALIEGRTICKVNARMCEISGYPAEELLGQTSRMLYKDEETFVKVGATLFEGLGEKNGTGIETTWLSKAGAEVDVFIEAAAIDLDDARTWRIVSVLDISAQKRAAEALREGEALFRAVFDGSRDAVLLIGDDKLMDCNARAVEMFGYDKESLLRLKIADLSPPNQPDERKSDEAASEYIRLAQKAGSCRFAWVHRRCNQEEFHAEISLSVFEFRSKRFVHGTIQDITERKRAEDLRRDMETKLQLTSKLESVGSLAAGVAHEINTPTQFISDNVRFLIGAFAQLELILASHRELMTLATSHPECAEALTAVKAVEAENELDYLSTEIPRCLEQSLDGLRRISKIVGSLKEFSHPGGESKGYADINRAIETTVAVSKHEWKYVADVATELDSKIPKVNCVIDEINQAILNLIINATHAIEDANKQTGAVRGLITIRTKQDADSVIIEVQDSGTGIPENVRDRIFEPFYTTKPVGRGTGQGLAIVQAVVVKKHHGDVGFTTELGKGTTFRLSLPLKPQPPGSSRQTWAIQ